MVIGLILASLIIDSLIHSYKARWGGPVLTRHKHVRIGTFDQMCICSLSRVSDGRQKPFQKTLSVLDCP